MTEGPWLTAEEQHVWRAYVDGTRLLLQALDRQLEGDAGISLADYEILMFLSEAPGMRMRMRDLASAVLSTRSGATRAVIRLEKAGWVRRVDCADDRRGTEAELTAEGLAELRRIAPGHAAAVREHVFDLLDAEEIRGLGVIGRKMRGHLTREEGR